MAPVTASQPNWRRRPFHHLRSYVALCVVGLLACFQDIEASGSIASLQWNPHWQCFAWNQQNCSGQAMSLANEYLSKYDVDFANLIEFESKDFKLRDGYLGLLSDQTACPKDLTQLVYNAARWEPSSDPSDRVTGCLAEGDRPFVLQAFTPKGQKASSLGIDGLIVIGAHFPHPGQRQALASMLASQPSSEAEPVAGPAADSSDSSTGAASSVAATGAASSSPSSSSSSSFYVSASSDAAASSAAALSAELPSALSGDFLSGARQGRGSRRGERSFANPRKRTARLDTPSEALAIEALIEISDQPELPAKALSQEDGSDLLASDATVAAAEEKLEAPTAEPAKPTTMLGEAVAASISSSAEPLENLAAALADVVKRTGFQQVLLIADTNEYNTVSSADIAADLSFPGNKVVGTALSRTCCEDVAFPPQFTFDRVIANFGGASTMKTQILLDDPLPDWTRQVKGGKIGAFHKPILGVLQLESGGGLGLGAILAIVAGLLLVFAIVLWLIWRARHRRQQGREAAVRECGAEGSTAEPQATQAGQQA